MGAGETIEAPAGSRRRAAREEQRQRLLAAMVACCAANGYEATSVADLLRASGVSRRTFYSQFDDKLACFRAAEGQIVAATLAQTRRQLQASGTAEERVRAALGGFVEMLLEERDAARMCFVESYAAGEPGVAPIRDAVDALIELGREALAQIPGRELLPPELARAIVGGFYQVIYHRLQHRREDELPALVPALSDWAMTYSTPPRPLRRARRRGAARPTGELPAFAAHNTEQRIIRAFAAVVAEKGYPAATIADVAAAAAISQTTFYLHFADKADVMEAALDSSGAQMLGAALPAARRARDWPEAVRVGLEACCDFLAAEPAFARLRMVDVFAAGPEAIAARDRGGMEFLGTLLGPAFSDRPAIPDAFLEATVGAVYGVFYERIRGEGAEGLPAGAPLLTYLALAPFIGAERAGAAATATPASRRRRG
ncbi:MAG TPA: TetR/AcrR family transcriptional regulator [Solirubrobacterales bacterium]